MSMGNGRKDADYCTLTFIRFQNTAIKEQKKRPIVSHQSVFSVHIMCGN